MAIQIRVTALKAEETWVLEFCASSDLTSGADTIPISNVRWTISGTALPSGSFQNGSLVRNVCQRAGTGPGEIFEKKAEVAASVQFYLANSRSYAPGTYTASVDVRVTVPGAVKTRTATLTVTIAPNISLTLGMAAINFRSADPDLFPSIAANENPITVTVQSQAGGNVTLTCRAMGDLVSGKRCHRRVEHLLDGDRGGIRLRYDEIDERSAGGTVGGIGIWNGTFFFFFANSWAYARGQCIPFPSSTRSRSFEDADEKDNLSGDPHNRPGRGPRSAPRTSPSTLRRSASSTSSNRAKAAPTSST